MTYQPDEAQVDRMVQELLKGGSLTSDGQVSMRSMARFVLAFGARCAEGMEPISEPLGKACRESVRVVNRSVRVAAAVERAMGDD